MSCVPLEVELAKLLEAFRTYPPTEETLDYWQGSKPWLMAREWGWIMESGELTGTGSRHVPDIDHPPGILE